MFIPPLTCPPDGHSVAVERTCLTTLTQPQLRVPHISLVFGEMWEMNLLSHGDPTGLVRKDRIETYPGHGPLWSFRI